MSFSPDVHVWYNITQPGTCLVSSNALYADNGTAGSVYLNSTVGNVSFWQFFPIGLDQYVLRSQALGPNATMQVVPQTEVNIQKGPLTNASLWSITTGGSTDGSYYFTNGAISNNSHLDINPPSGPGLVWMNSAVSNNDRGQRWTMHSIARITQTEYFTAPPFASATSSSTAATATSTTTSSGGNIPTSQPSNGSSTDSGLSTGAKAGIGAGIGGSALLLIIGLIFFFMRRKRGYSSVRPDSDPARYSGHNHGEPKEMIVYAHRKSEDEGAREMDNSNTRHEMYGGNHVAELEGNHVGHEKGDHAVLKDIDHGVDKDRPHVVKSKQEHNPEDDDGR
ncbi:hypothetical protein MBLNU457_g2719t1 [Dothideomycetes sp. NU457]